VSFVLFVARFRPAGSTQNQVFRKRPWSGLHRLNWQPSAKAW
jgi:hypothetical protein